MRSICPEGGRGVKGGNGLTECHCHIPASSKHLIRNETSIEETVTYILCRLVMCTARLQAVSRAGPSFFGLGRAGPQRWLTKGLGPAQEMSKLEPAAQATAECLSAMCLTCLPLASRPSPLAPLIASLSTTGTGHLQIEDDMARFLSGSLGLGC